MTITQSVQSQLFGNDRVIRLALEGRNVTSNGKTSGKSRSNEYNDQVEPFVIGKAWTHDEHAKFLEALDLYPSGPWKLIAAYVGTKTTRQTMTHAQKYRQKIERRRRGLRSRVSDVPASKQSMVVKNGGKISKLFDESNVEKLTIPPTGMCDEVKCQSPSSVEFEFANMVTDLPNHEYEQVCLDLDIEMAEDTMHEADLLPVEETVPRDFIQSNWQQSKSSKPVGLRLATTLFDSLIYNHENSALDLNKPIGEYNHENSALDLNKSIGEYNHENSAVDLNKSIGEYNHENSALDLNKSIGEYIKHEADTLLEVDSVIGNTFDAVLEELGDWEPLELDQAQATQVTNPPSNTLWDEGSYDELYMQHFFVETIMGL